MSPDTLALVLAVLAAALAVTAAVVPQARPVLACLSLACLSAAVAVEAS